MEIKQEVKYFLCICSIILVLLFIIFLGLKTITTSFWGEKIDRENIIDNFEHNINNFNSSLHELSNIKANENIYFNERDGEIIIKIHQHNDDGVTINYVKEKEYYKYQNTLNLINKFKLESVSQEYNNVSYQFNSMFNFAQKIVYIEDHEKYNWEYHVLFDENIRNKWYYVETK